MSFQPPSLYYISKPNPYYPFGTMLRRFDDGYEKVMWDEVDGRQQIVGYEGLVLPHRTLSPFLSAVKKTGVDMGSARMDRKKQMEQLGE